MHKNALGFATIKTEVKFMQPTLTLQSVQPSYIREILAAATADNVISLAGGLPATELLPLELLREACATMAAPSPSRRHPCRWRG